MLKRWIQRQNPWAVMFGVPIRRKPLPKAERFDKRFRY